MYRMVASTLAPFGRTRQTRRSRDASNKTQTQNISTTQNIPTKLIAFDVYSYVVRMSDKNVIASVGTTLGSKVDTNATILKEAPLENSDVSANPHIPSVSASAVLGESASMPEGSTQCRGFDFNSVDTSSSNSGREILDALLESFKSTGFQASNIGEAIEQIRLMRKWRLSDVEWKESDDPALRPPEVRSRIRARIFLGYTSNQISCGQREIIKFLVQHKMVDALVTTAGGIEEDIIKCFEPTFMGDFKLNGRELRKKGINRIGNLLVSSGAVPCGRRIVQI